MLVLFFQCFYCCCCCVHVRVFQKKKNVWALFDTSKPLLSWWQRRFSSMPQWKTRWRNAGIAAKQDGVPTGRQTGVLAGWNVRQSRTKRHLIRNPCCASPSSPALSPDTNRLDLTLRGSHMWSKLEPWSLFALGRERLRVSGPERRLLQFKSVVISHQCLPALGGVDLFTSQVS